MAAAANRPAEFGFITLSNEPIKTGALELPAELVFVPTVEEEAIHPISASRELREVVFEDEEADDVFEQSLSGLRLDDAAVEDEEGLAIEADDAKLGESTTDGTIQDALGDVATAAAEYIEIGSDDPGLKTEHSKNGAVSPRSGARRLAFVAASILFSVFSFAAGVGAALLFFAIPADVPQSSDLPVVAAVENRDIVPNGMALVPGGEFLMGNNTGDAFSRPAHLARVDPFYMDRTEVTNEAYSEFVKATTHDSPKEWKDGHYPIGEDRFPVTGVSWYDAAEFAIWSGKRLPTETEWEFAARGVEDRRYPWGENWDPEMANAARVSAGIRETGRGGVSPFGIFDMSGNVWEWTASDAKSYPDGKTIPWSRLRLKIIRGGNWQSDSSAATTFFRGFYGASGEREYKSTGFRCVKDLPKKD